MVKPLSSNADSGLLTIIGQRRHAARLPSLAPLARIINFPDAEPAPLLPGRSQLSTPPPARLISALRDVSLPYRAPLSPPPLASHEPLLSSVTLAQDFASTGLAEAEFAFPLAVSARRTSRAHAAKAKMKPGKTAGSYAESAEAMQHNTLKAEQQYRPPRRQRAEQGPHQPPATPASAACELQAFMQNAMQNMPHIPRQILQATRLLHVRTLRSMVSKENWSPDDCSAIKQALKHLMATEDQQRLSTLIRVKILHNPHLCMADKRQLLMRIRDNISALRPASALISGDSRDAYQIKMADLPTGLNHDFISILERFGITPAQLSAYLHATLTAAAMRQYDVLGLIDDEITEALAEEALPGTTLSAMGELATAFCHHLDEIAPVIAAERSYPDRLIMQHLRERRLENDPAENMDYLNPLDDFRGRDAEGISLERIIEYRELRILQMNFLRCAPLLELFKQTVRHDASFVERSFMNEEQHHVFSASQLNELKKILTSRERERAETLLNAPVLPFVFGDSQQPTGVNSEGQRYGGRGLPFAVIERWLNDPALSQSRLFAITCYLNDRLDEITTTGGINTDWITALSDRSLKTLFLRRSGMIADTWYDNSAMVLYYAVKEIARMLIGPDFCFPHLRQLTDYIRERARSMVSGDQSARQFLFSASHDELAGLLFQNRDETGMTLLQIAGMIRADRAQDKSEAEVARRTRRYLDEFITEVLTPHALHRLRTPEHSRESLNSLVRPDRVFSFIARRFNTVIIEENYEGDFQRIWNSRGTPSSQPPATAADAIIVRPGMLIPLAIDGRQQATVELEQADNHTLLQALVRHLTQQEGVQLDDNALDALVADLSEEILQSRPAQPPQ